MTKLGEFFVDSRTDESLRNTSAQSIQEFYLRAFVKRVRERATTLKSNYSEPINSIMCLYHAFNEISKEFGLEDQ